MTRIFDIISKITGRLSKKTLLYCEIFIVIALSILAISLIPKLDTSKEMPGIITLLGVGLVIILLTSWFIYFGIRSTLSLSKQVVLYTLIYNILVIIVKFILVPLNVWTINRKIEFIFWGEKDFSYLYIPLIGLITFILYFLVFKFIYEKFKSRITEESILGIELEQREKQQKHNQTRLKILLSILLFLIINLVLILVFNLNYTLLFLFCLLPAINYICAIGILEYFTLLITPTFYSFLIAICLVAAIYFTNRTFKSLTDQISIIRDSTILASFFWIGVILLGVYHFIWVVYFLVLLSTWPIKTSSLMK
ncbi:MAG: hypothetical protein ACO2O4_02045 [Minisyncoccia bacterium]|jgi:hypothetical protein